MKTDIYGSNNGNAVPVSVDSEGKIIVGIQNYTDYHVHHTNSTSTGDGIDYVIDNLNYNRSTVTISGTSTNRVIAFLGSTDGVVFAPVTGINLSGHNEYGVRSFLIGEEHNEIWQIPIKGLKYLRVKLEEISNGNVSVTSYIT